MSAGRKNGKRGEKRKKTNITQLARYLDDRPHWRSSSKFTLLYFMLIFSPAFVLQGLGNQNSSRAHVSCYVQYTRSGIHFPLLLHLLRGPPTFLPISLFCHFSPKTDGNPSLSVSPLRADQCHRTILQKMSAPLQRDTFFSLFLPSLQVVTKREVDASIWKLSSGFSIVLV